MKKFFVNVFLTVFILCFSITSFANELPVGIGNEINYEIKETDINNLKIYSNCILMVERETGDILYEKNAYEKMYPASTTKTLTAIIVLENCDLDEVATVSSLAIKAVPPTYSTAKLQVRRNFYC